METKTLAEVIKIKIDEINDLRKANKNKWFQYTDAFEYQGTIINIKIKCFNTWLQILNINNTNHNSPMDISVKAFKHNIEEAIKYHL